MYKGSQSEVFNKNGFWELGPRTSLPHSFCAVQINSTHTAIAMLSETSVADVTFYDWTTGEWSAGSPLQTACWGHDCTSLGNSQMMVAAGNGGQKWDNPESISSVEIYDFTLDSWFTVTTCLRSLTTITIAWCRGAETLFGWTTTASGSLRRVHGPNWSQASLAITAPMIFFSWCLMTLS